VSDSPQQDRIELVGIRAFGHHGVLDREREDGQTFQVDVSLITDTTSAARSDDLADTVDYSSVAGSIAQIIEGEPVNLIETLAERIAAICLADTRVHRVRVSVHKPSAPIDVPFDDVVVTIERGR
jgi:dihydroneopterin aldolase